MIQRSFHVAMCIAVGLVSDAGRAGADSVREPQAITIDREAVRLVGDVEEVSHDVRHHAQRLVDLAGQAGVSPWAHYHHLDAIKDLVNGALRPTLRRLESVQAKQPEWKQESIDRMMAAAQQLASDTNSAYLAKTKNVNLLPVMNDGYRQFLAGVVAHAEALVTTADAAHSYAVAQTKIADAGLRSAR